MIERDLLLIDHELERFHQVLISVGTEKRKVEEGILSARERMARLIPPLPFENMPRRLLPNSRELALLWMWLQTS